MNRSQKRGVFFFGGLTVLMLVLQIYVFITQGKDLDFGLVAGLFGLTLFCYFYPYKRDQDF